MNIPVPGANTRPVDQPQRGRMPITVMVVVLVQCAFVLSCIPSDLTTLLGWSNASSGARAQLVALPVQALFIVGLVYGIRLLWYIYRTLGLLAAILSSISIPPLLLSDPVEGIAPGTAQQAWLLFDIVWQWAAYFLMGTASARRYFSAICPYCSHRWIKPIGFFFGKAKCKSCHYVWV